MLEHLGATDKKGKKLSNHHDSAEPAGDAMATRPQLAAALEFVYQTPCPAEEAEQVTPPAGSATPLVGPAGVGSPPPHWMSADEISEQPSPAVMPGHTEPRQEWVVKVVSGGDLHVWARWHTTYQRSEGVELRFFDSEGEGHHRVASVRPGSWHWVAAKKALESASTPGEGDTK